MRSLLQLARMVVLYKTATLDWYRLHKITKYSNICLVNMYELS